MTNQEIKERAQMAIDWADGGEYEFRFADRENHGDPWSNVERSTSVWLDAQWEIRRKPEPKLRPWTPEEAIGRVVRFKGGGAVALVFSCNDTVARAEGCSWRLREMLVTHEAMTRHEDGSVTWGPCGVEEQA